MRSAEQNLLAMTHRSHLRELALPTIFGAAVLFVSATLLLGVNISALRANLVWIEHSQLVLRNVTNLETAIMGEEMTVRGFALTGDRRFLTYQDAERGKAVISLRELDRLTQSEPDHRSLFASIRPDVARHLDLYGQLKGSGPDRARRVAQAIVDSGNRALTGRIRASLGVLRNQEELGLGERMHEMAAQISRAFFLSIGIILVAILIGGFGLVASQLHISLRR